MQVKRLIELLSALDPEAHVFIGDDNADTEVEAARSNGYRVLLTGDTSLYGLGYDDGYLKAEDACDDGVDEGWKRGVEHGKTADYRAAYADGYDVGVEEVRRS